ncbi:MAG: NifB/NifX family molybdenum-iron cluster-binding protein [Vicinamibacterales bacterium]|nr:NifB/NifX family molybdenum-iron cluster-binding protein [Vicinamibacterales bacterium]
MSKAAFSLWNGRIAPVFDVARQVRVVDAASGHVSAETDEWLPDGAPAQIVAALASLGVGTLVCGAVSRPMRDMLEARAITVVPFVAGELGSVMQAWLGGRVTASEFAMPGCGGRGQGIGRRGGTAGPTDAAAGGRQKAGGAGRSGHRWGRMGGPRAAGAIGLCVCPACGHREPHVRGVPCVQTTCPSCGTAMTRGTADR